MSTLVVIGGGPKAAAIAARAAVLREMLGTAPDVIVLERHQVASNWTGSFGFTSGKSRLGTPPEKDVGFPYPATTPEEAKIARRLHERFSWAAYLIAFGAFGDWVDRGRPHPTHENWSRYLAWVLREANIPVQSGEVDRLVVEGSQWSVGYRMGNGSFSMPATGVVITGPGSPHTKIARPRSPRIVDGRSFWQALDQLKNEEPGKLAEGICVIGSGETAAAIVVALIGIQPDVPIIVVNRQGTIFSRGEGYHENRMFTDPGDRWSLLRVSARQEVIRRADRGVFSRDTLDVIDHAPNVLHESLHVAEICSPQDPFEHEPVLHVVGTRGDTEIAIPAAWVVDATGFDPWLSILKR